jgi:hypothetical protein
MRRESAIRLLGELRSMNRMLFELVSSLSPMGTLNWPILSVPSPSLRLIITSMMPDQTSSILPVTPSRVRRKKMRDMRVFFPRKTGEGRVIESQGFAR